MNDSVNNPLARYEINRQVKMVLTRHAVNLETLSISSSNSLVYLYGVLQEESGRDLTVKDIDNIFKEIDHIPNVKGIIPDFENWTISNLEGSWHASSRHKLQQSAPAAINSEDYTISEKDKISDVLKKMSQEK
jgi:hypothetical protein